MNYKEGFNELNYIVGEIASINNINEINEDWFFSLSKRLYSAIDSLPIEEDMDELLTTIEEISNNDLLNIAANKAKIDIFNKSEVPISNEDEFNLHLINNRVDYLKELLQLSDQQIVELYLQSQGGFYKRSHTWIPF